jgi:hypothetical protein
VHSVPSLPLSHPFSNTLYLLYILPRTYLLSTYIPSFHSFTPIFYPSFSNYYPLSIIQLSFLSCFIFFFPPHFPSTRKINPCFILIYPHLSSFLLIYPHLSSDILIYPHLSSSILIYPHLSSSILIYPHLFSSILIYPHLSSSILTYPYLSSSILIYPHLSSSILIYSHLSSSIPIHPVLQCAHLRFAAKLLRCSCTWL